MPHFQHTIPSPTACCFFANFHRRWSAAISIVYLLFSHHITSSHCSSATVPCSLHNWPTGIPYRSASDTHHGCFDILGPVHTPSLFSECPHIPQWVCFSQPPSCPYPIIPLRPHWQWCPAHAYSGECRNQSLSLSLLHQCSFSASHFLIYWVSITLGLCSWASTPQS